MTHVTIIGGGIAGLSAAFYLQKQSREAGKSIDYTLIEQQPRFGGKIITETVNDFVIEGGPDSFITIKPWGTQLCKDLGLSDEIIPTNDEQRNIFILRKGKLTPFPGGYRLTVPTEFVPFVLSPLISPLGKLRMGLDLFIPRRTETSDESLGSFIRRRLGKETLDRIAGPIMAGIYVADPDKLSMQSTFPQFIEMERQNGSLIKAMQKAKKRTPPPNSNNSPPSAMFTSLQSGMNELVNALVNQLNGDLHPNCRVSNLRYLSPGFEITLDDSSKSLKTDAVVLAIPAYVAAGLLEQTAPELSQLLRQIRYVSTATISLGYRRADLNGQHDFNGFGFVIPKSENRQILACTWSSTKFNHRAPGDHVLLRAFVGGDSQEHLVNLPDDDLLDLVRSEIAATMNVTATPVAQKIFRWKNGNPQYDVGHLDRVAKMEALAATIPGLYLTGSAFRGIGIPDCVKSARTTVEQILSNFS
jgi:oxygen-dependent protoporphyrinogen oxidase